MLVLFKEMSIPLCPQEISISILTEVMNFFCKWLDNKYFRPLQAKWFWSKLLNSTVVAQEQPKTIQNR